MSLALAILVVAGFVEVARRIRLTELAREAGGRARNSLTVLTDETLGDDVKERRLREEAVRLFRLFGRIAFGSAVALGLPVAALWGLDLSGLGSARETLAILVRLDFLAAVSVGGAFAFWLASRRRQA